MRILHKICMRIWGFTDTRWHKTAVSALPMKHRKAPKLAGVWTTQFRGKPRCLHTQIGIMAKKAQKSAFWPFSSSSFFPFFEKMTWCKVIAIRFASGILFPFFPFYFYFPEKCPGKAKNSPSGKFLTVKGKFPHSGNFPFNSWRLESLSISAKFSEGKFRFTAG